uniref:7TM_GPCR_Srx domain-containing protein n=1 Tax=Rhabditophanes sp. KR3021 TaxID=114890 RepID=A0AC35TUQ4_9BILA
MVTGVLDVLNMVVSALSSAIFALKGTFYCQFPTFIFVLGSIGVGIWVSTCFLVSVLAVNRILEMSKPALGEMLFEGKKTLYWILFGLTLGFLAGMFTPPVLWNPFVASWLFDPYHGFDQIPNHDFENIFHSINNIGTAACQIILYFLFIGSYLAKTSLPPNVSHVSRPISKTTIRLYIQTILICTITAFTALIHVFMQFISVPGWLFVTAQVCWILVHGFPGCVFLVVSKTLRRKILRKLGTFNAINASST